MADELKEERKGAETKKAATNQKASKNQFANIIGGAKDKGDVEGGMDSQGQKYPDPKPQFHEDEDPINYLGFGVSSYFQVIKTFIIMFAILSVIHIPVMGLYAKYGNYREESGEKVPIMISLGSMGFSATKCTSTGVATDKIVLSCKTGQIT